MTLNKTPIEWCETSWNPISGCDRGCPYCYARKIAERFRGSKAWPNGFKPTFHAERLFDPRKEKKPSTIFVCSMADIFGTWTPDGWINSVFSSMLQAPQHTYLLLTKDPNRAGHRLIDNFYQFGEKLLPSKIPENWWIGASVESSTFTGRIDDLRRVPTENRFVSFEPLLGDADSKDFPLDLTGIRQVIIGAQTKPTVTPAFDWILKIQKEADRVGAKVFCKDSLSYLNIGEKNNYFRRDLCWTVRK
jgi:protein gp37